MNGEGDIVGVGFRVFLHVLKKGFVGGEEGCRSVESTLKEFGIIGNRFDGLLMRRELCRQVVRDGNLLANMFPRRVSRRKIAFAVIKPTLSAPMHSSGYRCILRICEISLDWTRQYRQRAGFVVLEQQTGRDLR